MREKRGRGREEGGREGGRERGTDGRGERDRRTEAGRDGVGEGLKASGLGRPLCTKIANRRIKELSLQLIILIVSRGSDGKTINVSNKQTILKI